MHKQIVVRKLKPFLVFYTLHQFTSTNVIQTMIKSIYYAHPMSTYDTEQEQEDIALIRSIFPDVEIVNPNGVSFQEGAKREGMEYFRKFIISTDMTIFRSHYTNEIGAGVGKEITWAKEYNKPVLEIPTNSQQRIISVEETRKRIKEEKEWLRSK